MTTERERIIRARTRRDQRERWRAIELLIRNGSDKDWLAWWDEHMPIGKHDIMYMFGRKLSDSQWLRRHVRIECHYLRQSKERQFELESMFAGESAK